MAYRNFTGNTSEPDLSSKDLKYWQKVFNRAISNVPVASETLPAKPVNLTGTPKFNFKF